MNMIVAIQSNKMLPPKTSIVSITRTASPPTSQERLVTKGAVTGFHSNKVREWSDGMLFHVITTGQNAMPSYASQIGIDDRWRIINYVRALQRSRSAPERDVQ